MLAQLQEMILSDRKDYVRMFLLRLLFGGLPIAAFGVAAILPATIPFWVGFVAEEIIDDWETRQKLGAILVVMSAIICTWVGVVFLLLSMYITHYYEMPNKEGKK